MSAKLTRIATISLVMLVPWLVHGALAASTAADQKALELRQKSQPAALL